MIRFEPFHPDHLQQLRLRDGHSDLERRITKPGYGEALVVDGLSWTAICGSGVCGIGGILPQHEARAVCWALVGVNVPWRAWAPITRKVREVLELAHARGYRRLECSVARGHEQAERWALHLGFRGEGLMRCYLPDGRDCILASRIAA